MKNVKIEMTPEMLSYNYEAINNYCCILRQQLALSDQSDNTHQEWLSSQVKNIEALLAVLRESLTLKD